MRTAGVLVIGLAALLGACQLFTGTDDLRYRDDGGGSEGGGGSTSTSTSTSSTAATSSSVATSSTSSTSTATSATSSSSSGGGEPGCASCFETVVFGPAPGDPPETPLCPDDQEKYDALLACPGAILCGTVCNQPAPAANTECLLCIANRCSAEALACLQTGDGCITCPTAVAAALVRNDADERFCEGSKALFQAAIDTCACDAGECIDDCTGEAGTCIAPLSGQRCGECLGREPCGSDCASDRFPGVD